MNAAGGRERASLLSEAARGAQAARRRTGLLFRLLTFLPVVLALALIVVLLADLLLGSVSWQVVRPAGSGADFAWSEGWRPGRTWERVVTLDLLAQGATEEEVAEFLADPAAVARHRGRHRVELMWQVDGRPLRFVVTSSRDTLVANAGLLERGRVRDLRAGLEPGERLYLNPWLDLSFLTRNVSRAPIIAGLRSALLGSLWVIALVVLLALPLGVATAVYLEEYAPDNRFTRLLEVNLANLAGVPSIVYGILGLYVFVRLARLGPSVLAGALTLTLLILPVVVIAAREAIRAVPDSLRQASYALGATRWQTVTRAVLPNAVSGVLTGLVLAVARALGETAPLLVIGAAAFVPRPPDSALSTFTVVPIQIYSWVGENDPEFQHAASAAILALLALLAVFYAIAYLIRRRYGRRW